MCIRDRGRLLLRLVAEAGLPTELLEADRGETPVCDVYVTPDGDRTMFGKGFSAMDRPEAAEAFPLVPGAWFTAEPNMPEAARQASRRAAEGGMRVYLMDFVREREPIPPGGFWQTSTDWAGRRGDPEANLREAERVSRAYGCHAILTDGGAGFCYAPPQGPAVLLPSFACPGVVDSTGAGDAFRAGVLHGLHEGWTVGRALARGAAAGCLACTKPGASRFVPTLAELEELERAQPEILERILRACDAG
ncbi:MAG: carbohydrate kinase family protein, partial [Fimbriimonadales bacterium]|nr:carbohydrate kinase family protein [Fimbriimonadales bacterium]